jgi:ATP-dependent DNA helicase RecQ
LSIQSILSQVFGYQAFRGAQQDIIEHVVMGGDALVLMPTGGGKSLCYQIPAIARQQAGRGITVVISPLIALMHDQVGALHEAGVQAEFLNSSQSWQTASKVEQRLLQGDITLGLRGTRAGDRATLSGTARCAAGKWPSEPVCH